MKITAETPVTAESINKRTSVYTGMYSESDALRLTMEIFLLRRIEKDRILSERSQQTQNNELPISKDS